MKVDILGNIIKIKKGKKCTQVHKSDTRYIQIGDLRNDNNIKYCKSNIKNVLCNKNDILIAWDGANAGTIGYCLEGAIGSTIAKLSPVKEFNTVFVGRFLQSKFTYLRSNCTGATIPHISKTVLESIKIPLPPLSIQKQIANLLDTADELRRTTAKQLQQLDDLAESVFLEMFGDTWINPKKWKVKLVEDIAENQKHSIKAGPFGSSLKKEFYVKEGYKIYGQEQVIKDDLSFGDYYIDDFRYEKLKSCKVKEGDVLISLVGTYGKISVVPQKFEEGIINPRLMKISPNSKIMLPNFLKTILRSKGVLVQLKNKSRGGTMDIINVGIIRKIKIPVPPIHLQNEFAKIIQNIEHQKTALKKALKDSEDLFNSLLQTIFS